MAEDGRAEEVARLRERLAEVARVLGLYVTRFGLTDEARRVLSLPPVPEARPRE